MDPARPDPTRPDPHFCGSGRAGSEKMIFQRVGSGRVRGNDFSTGRVGPGLRKWFFNGSGRAGSEIFGPANNALFHISQLEVYCKSMCPNCIFFVKWASADAFWNATGQQLMLIFETAPRMYATFRHRAVAEVPIPIPVKIDRNSSTKNRKIVNFLLIF